MYLDQADRTRLDRLTRSLNTTKSDVLRSALQALERQVRHPDEHPALALIAIASRETVPPVGYSVAREHDRYFAEVEDRRPSKQMRTRKPLRKPKAASRRGPALGS